MTNHHHGCFNAHLQLYSTNKRTHISLVIRRQFKKKVEAEEEEEDEDEEYKFT